MSRAQKLNDLNGLDWAPRHTGWAGLGLIFMEWQLPRLSWHIRGRDGPKKSGPVQTSSVCFIVLSFCLCVTQKLGIIPKHSQW